MLASVFTAESEARQDEVSPPEFTVGAAVPNEHGVAPPREVYPHVFPT
jgi:hypothetical protein